MDLQQGGTAGASGIDYETQTNETLDFDAGDTYAEFTIPIDDDSLHEGNETFNVILSNPTNATLQGKASTITAQVTIVDDETPTLSVVDSTLRVSERAGSTSIELNLTGATSGEVAVTYSTSIVSGDTAEQDDFMAQASQILRITSSNTSGTIAIPIINNTDDGADEKTFTLTLSSITGAVFEGGLSSIVKKVTIIDDEGFPTLTSSSNTLEVIEGSGMVEIGLSLSPPITSGNVDVTYSTLGDTASNDGTDYTVRTNATHTITSDVTTHKISIPIINDRHYEPTETFSVKVTGVTGAVFAENIREISNTVTILDDEPEPVFSVQNTSVTVSESGNAEIVVQVTNPSDTDVSFTYSTIEGTATSADFVAQSSVQFTFGSELTDTISIPIINDYIDESNEQFTVTFADLTGATFGNVGPPTVTVTIEDDDIAEFSITGDSEDESNTYIAFSIQLSNESSQDTSVTWTASTESGNFAVQGEDYAVAANSHTGVARILAGSTSTTIRVPIADDNNNELEESFTVTLSNPTGGAVISDGTAVGRIRDNDSDPTITIPESISVNEEDGNVAIPISLSATTYESVSLSYYTTSAISATGGGTDFVTHSNRRHQISGGTSSSSIQIPIINDNLYEGPETFTVLLSGLNNAYFARDPITNQRVSEFEITVTIIDDESIPEISISEMPSSIGESAGTLTLRANLSNASNFATSVTYSTSDLTATGGIGSENGNDYQSQTNQTLNFPIGSTFAEISIPIHPDSLNEGDESFIVTLSSPSDAAFSNFRSTITQTITIIDDESPTLSVVSSSLNVSEDVGTAAIELVLSGPTSDIVEVTYSTSIIAGTNTAQQADFMTQSSESIVIVPTETIGIIAIPIENDALDEEDETFTLTLSNVTGAVFDGGASIVETVTILDDEELPTLSVDSTSINVSEGSGSATIGLTLSSSSNSDVSITYSTTGASASNDGTDYSVQTNSIYPFPSNSANGMISIPIIDDGVLEGNEVFVVTLTGISGATFGENINKIYVTVNIMDNTATQPILSVPYTSVSAFEAGNAVITLQLSAPTNSPVNFTYSTTQGTATSTDFTEQISTSHTFGTGVSDSIMIPITADDIDETEESFSVTFANLSGATFGSGGAPTITVIIQDDDQSLFSIANSSRSEPSSGTGEMNFTISLNKVSSRDTSVTWMASTEEGDGAIFGTDYAMESNSHTGVAEIPAGSNSTTISIPIAGNNVYEPNRENTFTVTLSNPTGGAGIDDATAVGEFVITKANLQFQLLQQ